jgi:hypothetical protein
MRIAFYTRMYCLDCITRQVHRLAAFNTCSDFDRICFLGKSCNNRQCKRGRDFDNEYCGVSMHTNRPLRTAKLRS